MAEQPRPINDRDKKLICKAVTHKDILKPDEIHRALNFIFLL